VRTPLGEIDLVAKHGNLVAFVEVKTRRTAAELDFAIDEYRLSRVAAAAEMLMPRYAGPGNDIRIDVILIAPRAWPRHIENAWIGSRHTGDPIGQNDAKSSLRMAESAFSLIQVADMM